MILSLTLYKAQNSHAPDKHWGYGCVGLYKVSKMGFYRKKVSQTIENIFFHEKQLFLFFKNIMVK